MNILQHSLLIYLLDAVNCYVNVALNKSAHQQTPLAKNDKRYDALNAVDGKKSDLSRNGGQCAVSGGSVTATWWVNLTSVHSIHHITIYYKTDNKPWDSSNINRKSFLGFSVYVSNTTERLQGTLCFRDSNFTKETIPSVFTAVCPKHGQYVIYYNERNPSEFDPDSVSQYAENNLCEVEVYGCPSKGCYGPNHSNPCPDVNCQYCHTETGTCQVCKPGYKGQKCEQECDTGGYGINCSKTCGYCHQSQCHNVDGICSEGCSAGYNGSLCTDPCEQGFYGINCSKTCNTNCSSRTCNHITGECFPSQNQENASYFTMPVGGAIFGLVSIIIIHVGMWFCCKQRKRRKITTCEEKNEAMPTTPTYAPQKYENIELGDGRCVSPSKKPPRKQGGKIEKITEFEDEDIDIDEKIHKENPYEDAFLKDESTEEIPVNNLWKVIEENSTNDDDGFKKEYAKLLYGERLPCEIGKNPENTPKNRFKTTFPYDHSRVVLEKQSSDYINANFIDGIDQKDAYIATQGPKQNTVNDFWLMVWQENVEQIVMLTNLKEGTREKCVQYWPNLKEDTDCVDFILITTEEKHYAYYVVRKMTMTNKKENETRTVTQYHFIAWQDHGVPEPLCLLLFHNHVARTRKSTNKGPTIVHCSAGIGRTGTYIAIDALYKEVQKESKIHIAEFVKRMREKRMNMVQTYEQYKMIFLTLYEIYKAPATVQNAADFIKKLQTAKMDVPANVSSLKDEFQRLLSVRPHYSEEYSNMSQCGNMSMAIQTTDNCAISLTSGIPNRGSNIYGTFITSFTNQNDFIVTRYHGYQAADGVVEFLRLITDYASDVVVFMEPPNCVESTDTWLPTKTSSKMLPPFTIQLQEEDTYEIKWRKVEITKEENGCKPHTVHLAEPTHAIVSDTARTVSQILELVSFVQHIKREGPVTVVSKDGSTLCGVFCAVYNLIQQLTMDDEIDVFSAVRLLHTRRPDLCSTMEEYQMINHAMMTFIQSQTEANVYHNQ